MKNKIEKLVVDLQEGLERRNKRIACGELHPAELSALRNQNNVIDPIVKQLKKILENEK